MVQSTEKNSVLYPQMDLEIKNRAGTSPTREDKRQRSEPLDLINSKLTDGGKGTQAVDQRMEPKKHSKVTRPPQSQEKDVENQGVTTIQASRPDCGRQRLNGEEAVGC